MLTKSAQSSSWYVSVDDQTVGPVTTELLIRGLQDGKVPPDAMVCPVGASKWEWVSSVEPFAETIRQSYPPPPPSHVRPRPSLQDAGEVTPIRRGGRSDEASAGVQVDLPPRDRVPSLYGLDVAFAKAAAAAPHLVSQMLPTAHADEDHLTAEKPAPTLPSSRPAPLTPLPRLPPPPSRPPPAARTSTLPPLPPPPSRPPPGSSRARLTPLPPLPPPPSVPPPRAPAVAPTVAGEDDRVDIPIDVEAAGDEAADAPVAGSLDWTERFVEQFELAPGFELPKEQILLDSLRATRHELLLEDDAMWNIALCVAFGTERVARAAATAFFEAVAAEDAAHCLAWLSRVLLNKGFMPSGIPREAGVRGLRMLRESCPPGLRVSLEREVLR